MSITITDPLSNGTMPAVVTGTYSLLMATADPAAATMQNAGNGGPGQPPPPPLPVFTCKVFDSSGNELADLPAGPIDQTNWEAPVNGQVPSGLSGLKITATLSYMGSTSDTVTNISS